ncbi:IS66 family transposase [Botrimarina hoheduenensis]|uniref:Transposase IS66 family protein n=1 Tax=Botrimarina hoheduenensis TaxID=2528000 RepID=A0A5C5VZB4_9BACT|nr:transposase [Botrimarina hoheduenensis]TWT43101.1 Transposase IS66 family protein [Botrimarina hoheduenensis]
MATVEELPSDVEVLKRLILDERREREGAIEQVTRGYLNIDNNASERALKRVALGRKNSY